MKTPKETGKFETRKALESFLFHQWASTVQSIDVVAKAAGVHKSVAIQILNKPESGAKGVYEVYAAATDLLDRIQKAPHNQPDKVMLVAETVHDLRDIMSRTDLSPEVLQKHGLPNDLKSSDLVGYVEKQIADTEGFTSSFSVFKG